MEFNNFNFIFLLLPITLIVYYVVKVLSKNNKIAKNLVLFIFSILFYSYGGFIFLCTTLCYLLVIYLLGILNTKFKNKKVFIIIGVVFSLSYMIVFKVLNQINIIALPLAISFICFQSCSYLIDVGREKIVAEKNIITFLTYSLLFTKLLSGPIMTYKSLSDQFNDRNENYDDFINGFIRFIFGLSKKVLIAGFIFEFEKNVSSIKTSDMNTWLALFTILSYSLYLYYDFSSYSDMAVGLSKMFGFKVMENFNYPYTALSITDFWRRWHISLSEWFKEYVYFPLGGSRKGKARTLINVSIVFLLTGIWHGFTLNYLLWGVYYAIIMVIEKAFLLEKLQKNKLKFLNVIYTLLIVTFGWIIFKSPADMNHFGTLFEAIFTNKGYNSLSSFLSIKIIIGFSLGILFAGYLQRIFKERLDKYRENNVWRILTFVFSVCLLSLCLFLIVSGSYSPSIYGGF